MSGKETCVWLQCAVCIAKGCEGCKAFLASGSVKGRELYAMHRQEMVNAITPVQRKYGRWLKTYKKEGYKDGKH